jgi:hypothetical protein
MTETAMTGTADQPQVRDLDLIAIGLALVNVAMISRLMGHSSMTSTVQDYIGYPVDLDPEQRFVRDIITGKNPMSEEEAVEMLQTANLPPLAGL